MKSFVGRFSSNFFKGLLALLPLFITLTLVVALFNFIEARVGALTVWVPRNYRSVAVINAIIEISTFVILVVAIALVGLTVKTIWGKLIVKRIDAFLTTIPGISVIYKSTRQVIDLLTMEKSTDVMQPVLVEYPNDGLWVIAFKTGAATGAFDPSIPCRKYYTIFIPTTPNPTSGFLILMPEEKIKPLNVPFESAIKMIFTAGMVKE
jgi:uncharacterized membrane protein